MNKKVWSPCCFVKSTEIKKAIANCTSLVLSDKRKNQLCQRCTGRFNRVVHSIKDGATLLFMTKIKLALYYFHVTQQECVTYSAR